MTLTGPGCSMAVAELEVQTGVFRWRWGGFTGSVGGDKSPAGHGESFPSFLKFFGSLRTSHHKHLPSSV